jgi:hypothetical protein
MKVGATRMVVHAQLRDVATNAVILERDFDAAETGNSANPFNVTAPFKGSKAVVEIVAGKIVDEVVKSAQDCAHTDAKQASK